MVHSSIRCDMHSSLGGLGHADSSTCSRGRAGSLTLRLSRPWHGRLQHRHAGTLQGGLRQMPSSCVRALPCQAQILEPRDRLGRGGPGPAPGRRGLRCASHPGCLGVALQRHHHLR